MDVLIWFDLGLVARSCFAWGLLLISYSEITTGVVQCSENHMWEMEPESSRQVLYLLHEECLILYKLLCIYRDFA